MSLQVSCLPLYCAWDGVISSHACVPLPCPSGKSSPLKFLPARDAEERDVPLV